MKVNRLPDYLDHMHQAASDACYFVEGLDKDEFLADKRTQQAVIMSLIVMFVIAHSDVPWRSMRGMRNRIAHGYFDINLDVVWDTVQTALPTLLSQLAAVRYDVDKNEGHDLC